MNSSRFEAYPPWGMRSGMCWRSIERGPVAGIVLVSDGRSNAGEDPLRAADAATRQGISVYLIAAGADEGPRNVRLAEIEANPVVFARDPMTLGIVVEARGLRETEGTIYLEQRVNGGDWQAVGDQRVALGEDGVLKRTTFRIVPRVVGDYEFRARVGDAGPELTLDDNVATAAVKVVRQQIRVLLVAGAPSPEVQFLHNALDARPAHRVGDLDPARRPRLQARGRPAHHPAPKRRRRTRPLRRPVADRPRHAQPLGPQWPELITNFVGKDGGGLIFVPGELYSQQFFEADESESEGAGQWTRLLPVVREPGLFRTEAQVRLSTQIDLSSRTDGRGARRPDL